MRNLNKQQFNGQFFLLAGMLACASLVHADDKPKIGVSADGQAYRVDKDGNQLVDYIAELEVNADNLEKRVYSLQDQLKAKQAEIDRLQKGLPATSGVTERDLSADAHPVTQKVVAEKQCPACAVCEDHSGELAQLSSTAQEYKNQVMQARTQLAQGQTAAQQLAIVQASLQKSTEELAAEKKLRLQYQEEANANQDKIAELQRTETTSRAQLRESSSVYGASTRPSVMTEGEYTPPGAALALARTHAVEELRTEVASGLARLQMAMQTRDALFSHFDQHDRALKIGITPLVASDGTTPNTISQRLASASTVHDLVQLREDVKTFEAKVDDDNSVIRRMSAKK